MNQKLAVDMLETSSGVHFSGFHMNGLQQHTEAEERKTSANNNIHSQPFVIGVAGGAASGKTTVCDMIIQQLHDQRVVLANQPLGKGPLQRLLLILCAHSVTRAVLVRLLLDMTKLEAEGSSNELAAVNSQRLYGCHSNVVYGRSQLLDGLPPLVLQRILEILASFATNHSCVGREGLSDPQRNKLGGNVTFTKFSVKHQRLLNAFIRQNPGLLEKSLSMMLKASRLIDFDNKRAIFRSRIRQQHEQHLSGPLTILLQTIY